MGPLSSQRSATLPVGGVAMGRNYQQLSFEDRCELARLFANGSPVRQIAAALDRSPSTISRELKCNGGAQVGYRSSYANQQSRARRWREPVDWRRRGWCSRRLGCRRRRQTGLSALPTIAFAFRVAALLLAI